MWDSYPTWFEKELELALEELEQAIEKRLAGDFENHLRESRKTMALTAKERIEAAKAAAQNKTPTSGKKNGEGEAERAASVNEIHISGHLGRDPEMYITTGGKSKVTASLGVWQNKYFNPDEVMWFDLVMWEPAPDAEDLKTLEEAFSAFLDMKKGQNVVVNGRFNVRYWKSGDKSGQVPTITVNVID